MLFRHYDAEGFEAVLPNGRTHPLIIKCRAIGANHPAESKVVKALGLPEVFAPRQLVAEVVGNAVARRMGVLTPEPCVVFIDEPVARAINLNLRALGLAHEVRPGPSAGCELLRPPPAPYAHGQGLTPEGRVQAVRMYLFDLLSQNPDRTRHPVNCGLTKEGLLAFDFELCFSHLFLPLIGVPSAPPWEPSQTFPAGKHLFYSVAKAFPPDIESTVETIRRQTVEWWEDLLYAIPSEWRADADKIGATLREIVDHAEEFAKDAVRSLL